MSEIKPLDSKLVESYIDTVSRIAKINLADDRQKAHVKDAVRLLNDANDLSKHVSAREFIDISPVTVYRW